MQGWKTKKPDKRLCLCTRWIRDEKLGFEKDKRVANFSVEAMGELLLIAYKEFLIDISENPKKLQDPAVADSIVKITKSIKSLEKDVDYLGISADVIKKATELIRDEYPNYLENWKNIVPRLLEHLEEEYGK